MRVRVKVRVSVRLRVRSWVRYRNLVSVPVRANVGVMMS